MKTKFYAAIAAVVVATPAMAQQVPDAKVAVVDIERVLTECTACRAANTQLQAQGTQLQALANQLSAPLQTEGQSLQTAVTAARGNPDAALQARIRAFQTREQQANQQIQTQRATVERNVAYVRQQIGQRASPIIQQIAQQRGATVALDKGSTLFSAPATDITDTVLTQLNSQLPSVSVTAPAQATAPAGAAPARPAPTTPARPNTGR